MFTFLMIELENRVVLVIADDYENIAVVLVDNHKGYCCTYTKSSAMTRLFLADQNKYVK